MNRKNDRSSPRSTGGNPIERIALIARSLLSSSLVALLLLGDATSAVAKENTVVLTVPVGDLIFSHEYLQSPDSRGYFTIGIKLPQAAFKAAHCDTPFLTVIFGPMNRPQLDPTPDDRLAAVKSATFYDQLVAISQHGGTVKIHLLTHYPVKSQNLKINKGIISTNYCLLSADESKEP